MVDHATDDAPGYWPSRWPGEDGGPRRTEIPRSGTGLGIAAGERLAVTTRRPSSPRWSCCATRARCTCCVTPAGRTRSAGSSASTPRPLEVIERSPDLPGGKTWPGGVAAHANGSIYVAFGRHAHRLSPTCRRCHTVELPRDRPYNSFVILPDGHLVLKDFGGGLPPGIEQIDDESCELLVLDPETLTTVARVTLPERSIARLSADGDDVYVVGVDHLWRVRWDGRAFASTTTSAAVPHHRRADPRLGRGHRRRRRVVPRRRRGHRGLRRLVPGREPVAGAAAPRRVDLATGTVTLTEVCGLPERHRRQPARDRRRAAASRSATTAPTACSPAFDIGPDGTLSPAGGGSSTTRATRSCTRTPASS